MDREEDHRRFLRIDLAGTIAATVANFSMGHPEKPLRAADFFEPRAKVKMTRRHREAVAASLESAFRMLGKRMGMIERDKDGKLIRTVGPVKLEDLKPGEQLTVN